MGQLLHHISVTRLGARTRCFAGLLLAAVLTSAAVGEFSVAQENAPAGDEAWEVHYIGAKRIGHGYSKVKEVQQDGRAVFWTEAAMTLKLNRFGQTIEQKLRIESVETPDGELMHFNSEMQMGTTALITKGRVADGKLMLETTSGGKLIRSSIDFPEGTGGFAAANYSLEQNPMKPGEKRTMRMLVPIFNVIADVHLVAEKMETTKLLDGKRELLRIASETKIGAAGSIKGIIWTDSKGKTVKSYMPSMDQTTYVTTKQVALAKFDAADFDFGRYSVVKLKKPLANLGSKKRVRYRITLPGEDLAKLFPDTPNQSVKRIDGDTAEIEVFATPRKRAAAENGKPTEADRSPNAILQSDHKRIVEMARRVAPEEKNPLRLAPRLEKYVHQAIDKKDFSQGFATAAEVAKNLQGDCTEHAVLLAALARARAIPARVAVGLVYVHSLGGFGYHMWTEVWADGRWMPLDATLGEGKIGTAHLKLADSDLKGAGHFTAFLPVFRLLGRLKIEVLEVEDAGE